MARAEVTGRKPLPTAHGGGKRPSIRGPPTHAFTVPEFCDAHRISKSRYYELKTQGLAPVEMIVGRRRLISFESAAEWRRQREATLNEFDRQRVAATLSRPQDATNQQSKT
jgi:hypothetical protein